MGELQSRPPILETATGLGGLSLARGIGELATVPSMMSTVSGGDGNGGLEVDLD